MPPCCIWGSSLKTKLSSPKKRCTLMRLSPPSPFFNVELLFVLNNNAWLWVWMRMNWFYLKVGSTNSAFTAQLKLPHFQCWAVIFLPHIKPASKSATNYQSISTDQSINQSFRIVLGKLSLMLMVKRDFFFFVFFQTKI